MRNQFSFIQFSDNISRIISLPDEGKDKKNPFIIVNTDDDRGLYVKKLEREIAKYNELIQDDSQRSLRGISTNDLVIFGDNRKYDYRVDMNYVILNTFRGKKTKVFDMITDFDDIVQELEVYCKLNGVKRRNLVRKYGCCLGNLRSRFVEEPKKVICPFAARAYEPTRKTLVNVYSKPDVTVEKITVHSNWV